VVFFESQPHAPLEFAHRSVLLGRDRLEHTGKMTCEPFTASTPRTCGSSRITCLNSSLFRISIAICLSSFVTSSGLAEKSTLTLTVATEKSALRLATVVICELGMT
jgi:hypothetical protein